MKIAIIDDEKQFQEIIFNITKKVLPDSYILTFSSVLELQKSLQQFDLILLDIEMPVTNGLDFSKHFSQNRTYIVFITYSIKYIWNAFGNNVMGYILKNELEIQLPLKLNEIQYILKKKVKIRISKGKIAEVALSSIYYVEANYRQITLHSGGNSIKLVNTLLTDIHLQFPMNLKYASRSYLVNLEHIISFDDKKRIFLLDNNQIIQASRKQYPLLKEMFLNEVFLC